MPFTDLEIAEHLNVIEEHFWRYRRPPVRLRSKRRESQRVSKRSIELFYLHPSCKDLGLEIEESIVKLDWVVGRKVWRIFWKKATGRWARYEPFPETDSLTEALDEVHADPLGRFFGA